MDRETAERLVREIERTPGWHAVTELNTWTGTYSVAAWRGDDPDDRENAYSLPFRIAWVRLRDGLAANGGQ